MEECADMDELMYYSIADRKLYQKIKETTPFLSHKQIDFLIDCYNLFLVLLPGLLVLIVISFMF